VGGDAWWRVGGAIAKLKAVYRSMRCLGIVSPAGVLVSRARAAVLIISVFVLLPLLRSIPLLLLSRLLPAVLALLLPREDVFRLLVRFATRLVPLAGDRIPIELLPVWGMVSVFIADLPLPALSLLILVLSISVFRKLPLGVAVLAVSPTIVLLSLWSWARLLSSFLTPIAPFLLGPFLLGPFLLDSFLLGPFLLWPLGIRRRRLWECGQWQ
jgi:hypothetical protein